MYSRPVEVTVSWIEEKFAAKPAIMDANLAAFRAGYNFGETAELRGVHYEVKPAPPTPGDLPQRQRDPGAGAGADRRQRPERPAAVLRQLSDHARLRAPARALAPQALRRPHGAGRGRDRRRQHGARRLVRRPPRGHRDERSRDGPEGGDDRPRGALELPLVIVDVQRAGPSTGMPTKTEAADLLMAIHGRHGESPLPVIAAVDPRRVLRRGVRGGADRGPLPHAGDPALRHLPRQLLRALALPDAADLPEIDPGFADGPERRRRVPALPARRARRPPLGAPGHARAFST